MKKCREKGSFHRRLYGISEKNQAQAICVFLVLLLLVLSFAFFGTWIRAVDDELAEPNYNDFGNWAALPQKKDGADYVAAGCGENRQNEGALADTFYVYPTSFFHQTLVHAHTQANRIVIHLREYSELIINAPGLWPRACSDPA